MDNYKLLDGFCVEKVRVSECRTLIELTYGNKILYLMAEGDCCSDSYFWSVKYEQHKYPHNKIEDYLDLSPRDKNREYSHGIDIEQPSTQECDILYPVIFTIKTGAHILKIVLRNSSNGYYGGSIGILESDHPYITKIGSKLNFLDEWQGVMRQTN